MDDLPFAVLEVIIDDVPLRLPQSLHDHLLGRLCRDTPEAISVHLDTDGVTEFELGIELLGLLDGYLEILGLYLLHHLLEFEDLDLSELLVEGDLEVVVRPHLFAGGGLDRLLQGVNQDLPVQPLFPAHLVYDS